MGWPLQRPFTRAAGLGIGLGLGFPTRVQPWTPLALGSALKCWQRGDTVVLNGGTVSQWLDRSGNGRHWAQSTPANQPTSEAAGLGGQPALYFDGDDIFLNGPSFASLSTSADVFLVMQLENDPPLVGRGTCLQLCSPVDGDENYIPFHSGGIFPNDDGKIYCGFFSTIRKSTGVAKGANFFEQPRIFQVSSAAGAWTMRIDGVQEYTTGTNTVSFASPANAMGGDPEAGAAFRYQGWFGELLVFSPSLSSENRDKVHAYLGARYGINV